MAPTLPFLIVGGAYKKGGSHNYHFLTKWGGHNKMNPVYILKKPVKWGGVHNKLGGLENL